MTCRELADLEAVLNEISGAEDLGHAQARARDGLAVITAGREAVDPGPSVVAGHDGPGVDPITIERDGPVYTVHVGEAVAAVDDELLLILDDTGDHTALTFPRHEGAQRAAAFLALGRDLAQNDDSAHAGASA